MQIDNVIKLARKKGVIRAADLVDVTSSRTLLPYLTRKGVLRRIAKGAYMLADHIPEQTGYIEVAAGHPQWGDLPTLGTPVP